MFTRMVPGTVYILHVPPTSVFGGNAVEYYILIGYLEVKLTSRHILLFQAKRLVGEHEKAHLLFICGG